MLNIEIFSSPGCGKCAHAKTVLQNLAESMAGVNWREVNVLDELDYAVQLGVLSTPAIAINGELVFSALPSVAKLREALVARLPAAEAS